MADFTIKIDTDQIATIVWDCPEKPFNILNFEAIKLLDSLVDEVLLNDNIIGAIITSSKPDFAAGMDLKVLADLKNLASAIQRITNAAIAGLLDGLMSDPCMKHLIMAGIAGFGLLQTIKKFT